MPKTKGPRPKHIPVRTCIACRRTDAKRGLIRIVRTVNAGVQVDPTGRMAGRGAYLCRARACWEQALSGKKLSAALRVPLSADEVAALRAYAASLPEKPPDEA